MERAVMPLLCRRVNGAGRWCLSVIVDHRSGLFVGSGVCEPQYGVHSCASVAICGRWKCDGRDGSTLRTRHSNAVSRPPGSPRSPGFSRPPSQVPARGGSCVGKYYRGELAGRGARDDRDTRRDGGDIDGMNGVRSEPGVLVSFSREMGYRGPPPSGYA